MKIKVFALENMNEFPLHKTDSELDRKVRHSLT